MRGLVQEPRVLGGLALLILSTFAGGVMLTHASQRVQVWQASHSLVAGAVVTSADVHVAEVAGAVSAYLPASHVIVGEVLSRDVAGGELLAESAVGASLPTTTEVMVPLERLHVPLGVRSGQRVDVWVTIGDGVSREKVSASVLAGVRIAAATDVDPAGKQGMVLAVKPTEVRSLIQAMHAGEIDVVRTGSVE